jgi:hypothetical protein
MLDRAKQQYLATLLNIASGKEFTRDIISPDGRTVSQAVQFLAELINDADNANDESAKDIAETLNLGGQVGAGIIPDHFENIQYRQPVMPGETQLLPAVPNPFRATTALVLLLSAPTWVQAEVHDVQGRIVATLVDAREAAGTHFISWDGRAEAGEQVSSGVYFVDVRADGRWMRQRLVLVH